MRFREGALKKGLELEFEIFDRAAVSLNDPENNPERLVKTGISFRDALVEAIKAEVEKDPNLEFKFPNTRIADTLFYHVSKYLRVLGISTKDLFLFPTVDTPADSFYVDGVFLLRYRDETGYRRKVVTLDAYSLAQRFMDYIWENLVLPHSAENKFLHFQNLLFLFKKFIRTRWKEREMPRKDREGWENLWACFNFFLLENEQKIEVKKLARPSNHFLVTPREAYGRRGLKTLGREIAISFYQQVTGSKKRPF